MKTRKMSRPNRIISTAMALVLALYTCVVPVSMAGAADASESTNSNYELAKTATNLDDKFESDIQLKVTPKGEGGDEVEEAKADVMFVLDFSDSLDTDNENGLPVIKQKMAAMIDQLKQHAQEEGGVQSKVGVVIFTNTAQLQSPLTSVASIESSTEYVEQAFAARSTLKKSPDSSGFQNKGTNLQGGIILGRDTLLADSEVPTSSKYLVTMTDGGTYWYQNKNGDPVNPIGCIFNANSITFDQNMLNVAEGLKFIQNNDSNQTGSNSAVERRDNSTYLKYLAADSNHSFGSFCDDHGNEIERAVARDSITRAEYKELLNGYNSSAATIPDSAYTSDFADMNTANNTSEEESSVAASNGNRKPSLQGHGNVYSYEDYPYINMERGTYFAAKELKAAQNANLQLITLGFAYKAGHTLTSEQAVAGDFLKWTGTIGTYLDCAQYIDGHADGAKTDDHAVTSAFETIAQRVLASSSATTTTLKAGSHIVDEMGYGTDNHGNSYDFDFVDSAESLSVAVKGADGTSTTTYRAAKYEGELVEGETSRYEFKADGSDDASFVLHYYANEATSNPKADSFRLDINRDIEAGEELTVNYKVHLTNPQTEAGTYGTYDRDGSNNTGSADVPLETNHVAKLQPKGGDEEKFPEPTVSYTVEPSTLTLTGKKVWNDAGNQDGVRPSTVAIAVYGSDNSVRTVAVTGSGNEWSFSVPDLPKKTAAGEDIAYTVDEPSVPAGYTKSVSGTTITNAHTPATTSVSGTKTWDDGDNQDGVRPSSITVRLLANGMNLQSKTVTAADNWRYSFTDLPKYAGGHEVAYTVTEDAVTDYTATVSGFNITNKHAPGKTSVSVTKAWNDSSNADGSRPSSVSVQLYADGVAKGSAVTLSAANSWAYTWSDLPEKAKGTAIAYTVAETGVAKGYTSSVSGDAKTGFIITNAHTPELVSVEGTKTWVDDDDQDGKRPSSIVVRLKSGSKLVATQTVSPDASGAWKYKFEDLPKYDEGTEISYSIEEDTVAGYKASYKGYNITNTYSPEQTRVAGTKVWKDGNDADGVRPKSVTVNLYANGEKIASGEVSGKGNAWAYRFTDLPKYAGGKKISYTVDEDAVEGYTSKVDGFKIVNTHKPEKVDISGAKVWNDANDQDGVRPSKVTVNLLADGEVVQSETVAGAGSTWHFSFTGLPRTKAGKEISYSVSEDAVRGYTASYSGNAEAGFTITNAHTPEQVSVSGAKTWDDDADRDGERPDAITVRLHANGAEVASKTVSAADNWRYGFSGLPKYSGGAQVVYTVTEDAVVGYSSTTRGANITNTHTPGLTSVTVSKAWDDDADRDSLRPASVSVQLNANGRKQGTPVTLNEDNGWTYTWHALYANEAGAPIDYTVEETDVPDGYTATVTGDAVRGYVISNEHEAATVEIPVTKVWDDDGDDVGLRPDSVTMRLYVNGLETDETLELTAEDEWTGAFKGLAKVVDGEEAVYTVEEEAVDGYEASVAGSAEEGYTVTNSLEIFDFDDHDTPLAPGSSFEGDDDSGSKASTDSDSDDGTDIDDDGTPTAGADGDDGDSSTGGDGGGNVHTGDDSPIGPLSALLLLALAGGSGALVARRMPGAKR